VQAFVPVLTYVRAVSIEIVGGIGPTRESPDKLKNLRMVWRYHGAGGMVQSLQVLAETEMEKAFG
jgi:hypothetical protein